MKREFMREVIALERNSRIYNRTILRIVDNPCNDRGFVITFVLAVSCHDAQRGQRHECAEYPNNSGDKGGHREIHSTTSVNASGSTILSSVNSNADLLAELVQFGLRSSMIGVLLQQFKKHLASFPPLALVSVDTREIQIGLIVLRLHADGVFKAVNGVLRMPRAQIKHAKIIQSLGINRAQRNSAF